LPAAALQYPLRHPAVVSFLPGIRSRKQAAACADAIQETISAQFWDDLNAAGVFAAEPA
jgi:D-threo-aldose 1-dehydrogenase